MKIECDKCGAKYSIADEKVRGKTFKIRCKKCSNVIIVRDKGAAAAAVTPSPAELGWHLAVNGETMGPMPTEEVRRRFQAGELDADTAVWREGFEDWAPIGDVDVFAELVRSVPKLPASPPPGDDPFASANQEDYAAGVAAAGGLAGVSGSSDPRVNQLTGQRNENSVLFSLDSLQSMATSQQAASPVPTGQRTGSKGLATVAPASEGSGLIDIRALGSMVQNSAPTAGATASSLGADDTALPSFGGAGLGGLAATPLVSRTGPEPTVAPAPPPRSNTVLYVVLALLCVAVVVLAVLFFTQQNQLQPVVEKPIAVAPSVIDGGGNVGGEDEADPSESEKSEAKDDEGATDPVAVAAAGESGDADEAAEGDGDEEKDPASSSTRRPSSSSSRKPSRSSNDRNDEPSSPPPSSSSKPKSSSSDQYSADCILNPNSPKCGGSSSSSRPKSESSSRSGLPDKLGVSDIKAGLAPVRGTAKSCGSKHGAQPGEKVSVKISISGRGSVASATALPPHAGTSLGKCVADAAKKAKFKQFKSSVMGVKYSFKM